MAIAIDRAQIIIQVGSTHALHPACERTCRKMVILKAGNKQRVGFPLVNPPEALLTSTTRSRQVSLDFLFRLRAIEF